MSSELSMKDAIKQFLKSSRLEGKMRSCTIEEIWGDLMGKTIARYTDKVQIVQNTLFITTSVAPLKSELHYQKNLIVQRVNEALGENVIQEVVIR